jgi:ribonuclease P protein component
VPLTFSVEIPGRLSYSEGGKDAAPENLPNSMPAKKATRFPRAARLLRHADFERVYKQGRRHFSGLMTVFYWPRPDGKTDPEVKTDPDMLARTRARAPSAVAQGRSAPQHSQLRVGFTVGRALGGAVQRNRMKRRLREAVRMSAPLSLSSPLAGVAADVVINPKKSLLAADFSDVLNEVRRAFVVIEGKLSGRAGTRTGASAPHEI